MKKLAVYSTYCGTTKNLTFAPYPVHPDYPHYFISNNRDVLSAVEKKGWTPLYLAEDISADPIVSAQQAKIAKVLPHRFPILTEYAYTLYKDDKCDVDIEKIVQFLPQLIQKKASLAIRPHRFLKNNLLFEFGEAMLQERYKSEWEKSVSYITNQINNGAKLDCKNYETGVLLRDMGHPDTLRLNEMWYDHISQCGIECQISFDIVAQNFTSIIPLPTNMGTGLKLKKNKMKRLIQKITRIVDRVQERHRRKQKKRQKA